MKTIECDAVIENLPVIISFIEENLESVGCSMGNQTLIEISVEELFVNIAHYAYHDTIGKATITFDYEQEASKVIIQLIDSGIYYNPLSKEDPDITLSAEEREIGGLGIFMVKKNMDEFFYDNKNNQNITTITKKI